MHYVMPSKTEASLGLLVGRTAFNFSLALAILCTYTMVALAAPQGQAGPTGDLSVVGEVSVNGTSAISGATVFSDSTIATGQNSSAVVSLGKLGRVELLPNSSLKLSFTDKGVSGMLESGRVRVSSSTGVAGPQYYSMTDMAWNAFTITRALTNSILPAKQRRCFIFCRTPVPSTTKA